jgi:hypothetical protein
VQLETHPEIAMAQPARPEPKVFLSPDVVERGLEWYEATYFSHATTESLLGEKSTSYLEDPAAAERAAAVLGPVPIVVQLRDPVARAVSNWRFSSSNGLEQRPLEQALEDELAGRQSDWDRSRTSVSPYAYLERGRYAEYLAPWFAVFAGSMHVRFLEEQGDARTELYAALGVDVSFVPPRQQRPERQSEGPAPRLAGALDSRLRAYFGPADERLRELLGRDLPWSTS